MINIHLILARASLLNFTIFTLWYASSVGLHFLMRSELSYRRFMKYLTYIVTNEIPRTAYTISYLQRLPCKKIACLVKFYK